MNTLTKKTGLIAILLLVVLALSVWFYVHKRQNQNYLKVNCSTIIRYNHQDPDFVAMLDLVFRLDENHDGQAILSGNIYSEKGAKFISRTALFSYEINRPGEISIMDMRYLKNPRDTADEESFKSSFFYVPDGTVRQLRVEPSNNGWLLGNLQSPFALCVNREG
ncbi:MULTISPECIES: hypothetical protein [Citrobacter]|jgi:hypothetical protein|uniref:hypothetical protein n=1 Tax=Citrobacter TaxID=544 RepID=UPI001905B168|nr:MULTISPECIES: hypothetical protein [Citrobacter]EHG7890832.1 hypothetical protein [Citrobacter braakii]MBJ9571955.1 hypothetical protein [Citrobacter braakii]MDM3470091.1 hypothetical protein [Citrobacter sp. Cb041]MDU2844622.1 hypothetical protein [Citrobacter sp.]